VGDVQGLVRRHVHRRSGPIRLRDCVIRLVDIALAPQQPSLQIDTDEEVDAIYERHEVGDFDTSVADQDFPILAKVIQKCWQGEYQSTDELLTDVQLGHKACSKLCEKSYWPFRVADDHYLRS
jgi:hypothetical protein